MPDPQTLQVIGLLFRSINIHFRQEIDRGLQEKHLGISFGEISPLSILRTHPGSNGAQLARMSMVSPQAMHGVLRQLAQKQYIERREHPDNQRADSWYLTEQGTKLLNRARTVFNEVTSRMVSGLSPQEVKNLEKYLRSCATSLGSTGED